MPTSRSISKAVILTRGLGTRMRSEDGDRQLNSEQSVAAASGMKAMIPVGRPFLDYVLSNLALSGFQQVCLVIGPEHGIVRDYYCGAQRPTRIRITFAVQPEALGTANAVLAAEDFAGGDEFLTMNGDNYYPLDALLAIQELGQAGAVLFVAEALVRNSNISAQRIKEFAYAMIDDDGFLADLIEKPKADNTLTAANERLVSMNCWRFGSEIFNLCREVPLSVRGEFELPPAVKLGMARGLRFKTFISRSGVLDLSRRSDIASVAARLKNVRVDL
jgi:dTDP-glucose pyrophosphorylase